VWSSPEPAAWGDGSPVAAARHGREAVAARLGEATARYAWQGQHLSIVTRK
jgi:hypothetical protein